MHPVSANGNDNISYRNLLCLKLRSSTVVGIFLNNLSKQLDRNDLRIKSGYSFFARSVVVLCGYHQ